MINRLKIIAFIGVIVTSTILANWAVATELRFTEMQMPLGTTSSAVPLLGNEYLSFGISTSNAYRYSDSSDPFSDGAENLGGTAPFGLALNTGADPAHINFLSPVSHLEVDWWTITTTFYLDVFDTSNNIIHSFNGAGSGTEIIDTLNIGHLEWHDSWGYVMISNIRFDAAPVPEPATMLLLGSGLLGLWGFRKKFKK